MKFPALLSSTAAIILTGQAIIAQVLPVVSPPDLPVGVGSLPAKRVRLPIRRGAHTDALQQHAASPSIPLWSGTTNGYTYQMVGVSPFTAQSNPTTTVGVPVIPLVFAFSDGTVLGANSTDPTCLASPVGSTARS